MVGLVAFVGAVLGSTLGYLGAARATREERVARKREEWGRRFTHALELCLSGNPRSHRPGVELLTFLSHSELASTEERDCALVVLQTFADTVGPAPGRRLSGEAPGGGSGT